MVNKRTASWEMALAPDSTAPTPAFADLFDGSPDTHEERDISRKFTLDVWNQTGITYKAELAQQQVEYLQRGAFDRSVAVVDYMVHQRDLQTHPDTRDFADQLWRQAATRNANVQYRIVDIAAGRLMDLAGRSIDPDPEPERRPGFWERVFGS